MQHETQRTITLHDLNWGNIDQYAHQHGFRDRSNFIEYCVSKEIHKRKLGDIKIVELLLLFGMALTVLLLLLLYMR